VMTHWVVAPLIRFHLGPPGTNARRDTPGTDARPQGYSDPYGGEIAIHSLSPGEYLYEVQDCRWNGGSCFGEYVCGYSDLLVTLVGEGDKALFDKMKELYEVHLGV
jgi:hypothetical protein